MLYNIIPEQPERSFRLSSLPLLAKIDPYDYDAFSRYSGKLYVVATNCETGEAEYFHLKNMREEVEMLQASSSLP